ncbi:hypothetical protein [Pontiella agarivorans]|uniref:Protein BatD n=1 Tax=Pontiella agarivorans TaxID=3038953 RepID=A0ABU5MYK9_9BACT|nr:hypothetical protein [Pontiella agarivorans]MDZ8119249.1 hypothetical protein [Pontiella agarivorans]
MKTDTYRSAFFKSTLTRVIPWLVLLALAGCKEVEQKAVPQDRLTVEYSVDREDILIGDPVQLTVTAYYPTNGTLVLPEIGREKDVVLLSRDWNDIPREDGLTQSETRYSITSFRLGEHVVSTGTISCAVGEDLFSTNFPDINLTVSSSLPDDASSEIADLQPVHKLPGRIPAWVWIIPGSVLLAFLIGLLTSKLWKNRETLIPSAPPVPPHIIAFQALETLKNKGLLEKGECNPFYTELSLILRTYLDGRFRLNATDETTEEIVENLSRSPELNMDQQSILRDFMTQADMVKFAKGHPDRSTMESAFATTQQFVEETKMEAQS